MNRTPLLLLPLLLGAGALSAKDFKLYYLGGQSNMDGYGFVSELPDDLAEGEGYEGVYIFHGNIGDDGQPADGRGLWTELKPGHGRHFTSDGETNTYSDRFGVELTFARRLKAAYPDANIALLKYSRGGTSIDSETDAAKGGSGHWNPDWDGGEGDGKGINQFDHFVAAWEKARAIKDIDGDGEEDRLIPSGIVWMQGESDSKTTEIAGRYEAHLSKLMARIRAELGTYERLPVVIGRITDWEVWTHGDIIRQAQADFVAKDGDAALVTSTDSYGASDTWHYDTAGYIDLGTQFGEAMIELESEE